MTRTFISDPLERHAQNVNSSIDDMVDYVKDYYLGLIRIDSVLHEEIIHDMNSVLVLVRSAKIEQAVSEMKQNREKWSYITEKAPKQKKNMRSSTGDE